MVQTVLFFAAGFVSLTLASLILFRRGRNPATCLLAVIFIICTALDIVDRASLSFLGNFLTWKKYGVFCESLLPPFFFLYSVIYGRNYSWKTISLFSKALIWLSPALPLTAFLLSPGRLFYSPDFHSERILFLSSNGFIFYITVFVYLVAALANLEATYRSAGRQAQWQIKFTLMGTGSLVGLYTFYYSQGLLYRSINMNLVSLRSFAILVSGTLLIYSLLLRDKNVRVTVSKEMAFRSMVLIIIGGYLLALGLLGQGLRYFGDSSQQVIFLSVFFLSTVFLVAVLLSEKVKRKIKVFINKNFFENKYDYRVHWLEFTNRLAAARNSSEIEAAILSQFCETFAMGGALFYLWSHEQGVFYNKSCSQAVHSGIVLKRDNPLIKYMIDRQWVFNVLYVEPEVLHANRAFIEETKMRFVIPVFAGDELEGFIALVRPLNPGEDYTYEDYDLMKTLARQASVALTSAMLSERLAEVREMEAVGKVTTFIMHDLKNLVYSLSLLSANANDFISDPEFQKDLLEALSSTVMKMKALIAKLKEVPDRHELNLRPVNLLALVKESVASLKSSGINIDGKDVEVCIDSNELGKVILNLLINALDATDGKGPVCVEVGGGDRPFIRVSDVGCGMTLEYIREELFIPFRTTKSKGLGIGLYQCRQIVEAHHGRIEVESQLGKGSIFTVWLPLQTS